MKSLLPRHAVALRRQHTEITSLTLVSPLSLNQLVVIVIPIITTYQLWLTRYWIVRTLCCVQACTLIVASIIYKMDDVLAALVLPGVSLASTTRYIYDGVHDPAQWHCLFKTATPLHIVRCIGGSRLRHSLAGSLEVPRLC